MSKVVSTVASIAFTVATGGAGAPLALALKVGASLALSFLQEALAPKPDKPDLGSFNSIRATGVTQQFSQPVTERRVIYGETRVSGPVVYAGVTDNNRYLHLVLPLAGHQLEEIGEILIDETSIPVDAISAGGTVTTGKFANRVRIKKYLGTASQTADADLVAEVPEWTTDHRLQGIPYIYVRYEWNRDVFSAGIPNISAWVKGKPVLDTRDATVKWTPNLALCARDYLVDQDIGVAADTNDIDETVLNTSANTCEEFITTSNLDTVIDSVDAATDIITLEGDNIEYQTGDRIHLVGSDFTGVSNLTDYYAIIYQRKDTPRMQLAATLEDALAGTALDITGGSSGTVRKIAEPRYFGGGVLKTDSELGNNLRELYVGMAGQIVYAGGVWRILAGEYQNPTLSFGIDDLAGDIKVQTKVSKRDRFNRVQGIYISPLYDGNPTDYPAVENSTYQTEDGEVIKTDLDLAFVQRPHSAQRVAKIYLERMRQEIVFTARFKLTAFQLQVGDNFLFTVDRYGWSDKVFEVIDWELGEDSSVPYIELTCRENASAVYDWNSGEETTVDPAPNTSLPNPFEVSVVTGFSLDSVPVFTQSEDRVFNVIASWETPVDLLVSEGGKFEVEYKEATQMSYVSAGQVDGTVNEMRLPALQPDVLYDIRVFAYNSIGVKSAENPITGFLVGTTVTTNTEDWENETLARDGADWENQTLTSEDFEA